MSSPSTPVSLRWSLLIAVLIGSMVQGNDIWRAIYTPDRVRIGTEVYTTYTKQYRLLANELFETHEAIAAQSQAAFDLSRAEARGEAPNAEKHAAIEKSIADLRHAQAAIEIKLAELKTEHEEKKSILKRKAVRKSLLSGALISGAILWIVGSLIRDQLKRRKIGN